MTDLNMNDRLIDQAFVLREKMRGRRRVKVLTIASGKGGVGKSTLAVNLAIALSRLGMRVLVLDADFGLANVDIMLGIASRYNLSHVLSGERDLSDIVQLGHENVRFISGGSGIYELLHMDETKIQGLMDDLAWLSDPVDYILCDIGAGVNDNIIQMILASSETIVVMTTEPTSALDAYALIKTILRQDQTHTIYTVMNKCETQEEAEEVLNGFAGVVERNLGKELFSLGHVLYDSEVPQSIKRQLPISLSNPEGVTTRCIRNIARTLLDLPVEAQPPPRRFVSLFSRLFRER